MADFIPDPTVMAATTIAGLDGQVEAAITAAYNVDGKQARTGVTFDFRKVPKHHTFAGMASSFSRLKHDWQVNNSGLPLIIEGTDRPATTNVNTTNEKAHIIERMTRLHAAAHFPVPQWSMTGSDPSRTPRCELDSVSFSFGMAYHHVELCKDSVSAANPGAPQYFDAAQIAADLEVRVYACDAASIQRKVNRIGNILTDVIEGDTALTLVAVMRGLKTIEKRVTGPGVAPTPYTAALLDGTSVASNPAPPAGLLNQQVTYLTPAAGAYTMRQDVFAGVVSKRHMVGGGVDFRPNSRLIISITGSQRLINAGEDYLKDQTLEGDAWIPITDSKRTPLLPVIGGNVWPIFKTEWCQ